MEAARQDRSSECRRCREHGYIERRVDQEGHEAEESPEQRAVRARGEVLARSARCAALVRTVVSALCARSAVVHQSASTVVERTQCKECGGHQSASTVVSALSARSAVGREYASTVVCALQCKECGGGSICEHGRERSSARSAVGHQSASTVVGASVQGVRWVTESASTVVGALVQGVSKRTRVIQHRRRNKRR